MKKFMTATWMVVLILCTFFGMTQANAEVYTVRAGDTLGKIAGKNWKAVCEMNSLKNCNMIRVGQRLELGMASVHSVKTVTKSVSEFRWTRVGGAPLTNCGGKTASTLNEEAWMNLNLTHHEKHDLREMIVLGAHQNTFVQSGEHYKAVAFCKNGSVSFKHNVVTAWVPGSVVVLARTYVLTTGRKLHWVRNCNNWVLDTPVVSTPVVVADPPKEESVQVVADPPKEESVPVVIPPETEIPTPPPSVLEEKKSSGVCAHQVDAYTGAGKVWNKDSHYGYIGFDWYVKQWSFIDECGETHRLGFGADYAAGSGQAGTDGTFRWDAITLRPVAYKYTGTDGKTLRIRILITRVRDGVKADMDRYQNERTIFEWGPEVIFTDQGRKDSGHKWFSEHRASVAVLFAFNKSGSHSWEGTPITDTAELLKVKGMVRAGARLYIYDLDGGQRVFVQAGLSAQWPNVARSLGVSVGLDGPDELWTVFVGPNFDLKEHTHSFGVEVSLQIGKAYLYFRGLAAQSGLLSAVECIESDGNAYFPSTGVLVSGTCPKDTATGATPISVS